MTTTAKAIRAQIARDTEGTGEKLAAVRAIGDLRRKVEDLRHKSTHADTIEACEAAARELVSASEDLRIAEVVAPMKQKAANEAAGKQKAAYTDACRTIANHFEKLGEEANGAAVKVAYAIMCPSSHALSQYEEAGRRRDHHAHGITNFMPGVVLAWERYRIADNATKGDASSTGATADAMLETFDADTAKVLSEIEGLKRTLSLLGGDGDSGGGGIVAAPAASETAESESELAAV